MIKYREITDITHVTDTISIYLQELISRLDSRTLPHAIAVQAAC